MADNQFEDMVEDPNMLKDVFGGLDPHLFEHLEHSRIQDNREERSEGTSDEDNVQENNNAKEIEEVRPTPMRKRNRKPRYGISNVRQKSRKAAAAAGKPKRKYRIKSSVKALREIKRYQQADCLMIPKAAFMRLVKEVCFNVTSGHSFRFQSSAIEALQEAAEAALVTELGLANLAAIHAKRITIQPKDMQLVRAMRNGILGYSNVGGKI